MSQASGLRKLTRKAETETDGICKTDLEGQAGEELGVGDRPSATDVMGGGGGGGGSADDTLRGPGDSTPESAWSSTASTRVFVPAESHH